MAEWSIVPLDATHERSAFRCGKGPLDTFLQRHAAPNHARGVSRVFVVTRVGEARVAGYYASAAGVFNRDDLPPDDRPGLPAYPLPTAHLGRLAVDKAFKGNGLGRLLLFHFLRLALEASEKIGLCAVDLWAKDDEARSFYFEYGFIPLQDDDLHLYLPMGTVRMIFPPPAK